MEGKGEMARYYHFFLFLGFHKSLEEFKKGDTISYQRLNKFCYLVSFLGPLFPFVGPLVLVPPREIV